ncbi:MAG TPA: cell division protein FtsH, partial [Desulfobacteraceae bacterium]|nr:cell division protein FtsH [Desulfobacteraceae bacterium]
MNTFYKNLSLWLVIGLTMILLFNVFNKPQTQSNKMTYSEFWSNVQSGLINRVTIQDNKIMGKGRDGRPFVTVTPNDSQLIPMLRKSGVDISVKERPETPWYVTVFVSWFPMLLLIGVWVFFMRQMQMGGKGGALSFGKTRAKLQESGEKKVTFE